MPLPGKMKDPFKSFLETTDLVCLCVYCSDAVWERKILLLPVSD